MDRVPRDQWLRRGCPERMTIRVRSTGETIVLVDGLPVAEAAEAGASLKGFSGARSLVRRVGWPVTDNRRCRACQGLFSAIRGYVKYCSERCRRQAARLLAERRKRLKAERLLSAIRIDRGGGTCAGS